MVFKRNGRAPAETSVRKLFRILEVVEQMVWT